MSSTVTEALGGAARQTTTYLVIGVDERDPPGTTIYNTTLYIGPDGRLLAKHRKLMPTGSERSVWGMGDDSTLIPDDSRTAEKCGAPNKTADTG